MALVFVPGPHRYELDGVVVPSVTQILRTTRAIDLDHVPILELAEAMERGTRVHQAIALYQEHDLDEDAFAHDFPALAGYFHAYLTFCRRAKFVPVLTEQRVASRRHQLAGTIDCLGLLDGRPTCVDWKTGQAGAADLQLAAYHALLLEWAKEQDADPRLHAFLGEKPAALRRCAVLLRNDGTFKVETYDDPGDYSDFIVGVKWYHICARGKRGAITETAA